MKIPYVHSNFERIQDDNYQTIDKRCVYGFLEFITPTGLCVDVCSPSGSGIVETLKECGYNAEGVPDAYSDLTGAQWVVTNTPYKRGVVDSIILRQIKRIERGEVAGVACLLRSNFSFAKGRVGMFRDNPFYYGEIKLLFRPWWSEDRKAQPIHNYVWHIWRVSAKTPFVMFANGEKP